MPIDLSGDSIGAWTQARLVNFIETVITNKLSGNEVFRMMDVAHSLDSNIGTQEIADGSITNAKMAANAISTATIIDDAVTSVKILDGTITNSDLSGGYPNLTCTQTVCNSDLTITTSFQDLSGTSVSMASGTYLFIASFDFFHSVNGGGVAIGALNIAGSDQSGQALLLNSGAASGDRATVVQTWTISFASTSTCKLRASKTINAGTVQALNTHSKLQILKLGV